MNKFIFTLALCLSLAVYGNPSTLPNAEEETQTASSQEKDIRVEVLCFHTKKRCVTCTAIEKNAQETVETLFAEEVKTGRVVFKTIDLSLEENKKNPNIVTLPSGLQYEVITEGNGKKPKATDHVRCHYEGTLIDGTLFDSSIKRGEPAVFGVNQVIKGWVEALQLMSEGAKWKLYIPSELAYGAQGAGEMIPPHSTLIFEVELIEVL